MATKKCENYYKLLKNLTIEEIYVFGLTLGIRKPTQKQKKNDLIREILKTSAEFLDDEDRKFYFSKDDKVLKFIATPTNTEHFTSKSLSQSCQIDIEKVKREMNEEKNKSEEAEASIVLDDFHLDDESITGKEILKISEENQIENLTKLLENSLSSKNTKENNFHFRQKIKYEPSHGIEAFIRSVEAYTGANNILDQRKSIAIAKSALNQSEDGLLIQDCLLPAEEMDWDLFKNKLLSILGRSPDYYRDFYRSFRRGTQKLGLAMSRLTQAYKRGFLQGQELSSHDKKHIMLQFIESLDNPLRGLVKAEEQRLDFGIIADRAAELERCFGSGFGHESAAALMFPGQKVQMVNAAAEQKISDSVQLKMLELLTTLTTQSKNQHSEMMKMVNNPTSSNYQNRSHGNPLVKELAPKLKGHCYYYVKNGSCRRGNSCTYKHPTVVPEDIKKIVA